MGLLPYAQFMNLMRNPVAPRSALLGIDWGSKHVGVAIAAGIDRTATPLTTLATSAAPTAIRSLVSRHQIFGVVIGWPVLPDGSTSQECLAVQSFVDQLQSLQIMVPMVLWNERGTSAAARSVLRTGSHGRKTTAWKATTPPEKRHLTDETAAACLLNDFIMAARPPDVP